MSFACFTTWTKLPVRLPWVPRYQLWHLQPYCPPYLKAWKGLGEAASLPIHFAPMTDSYDKHNEAVVFNAVQNSVVSCSNPQKSVPISQLFGVLRARILTEPQ